MSDSLVYQPFVLLAAYSFEVQAVLHEVRDGGAVGLGGGEYTVEVVNDVEGGHGGCQLSIVGSELAA